MSSSRPLTAVSHVTPTVREQRRADIAERLLDALDALVHRHRALLIVGDGGLHAELITAEVAHQVAVTRTALRRTPPVEPPAR